MKKTTQTARMQNTKGEKIEFEWKVTKVTMNASTSDEKRKKAVSF